MSKGEALSFGGDYEQQLEAEEFSPVMYFLYNDIREEDNRRHQIRLREAAPARALLLEELLQHDGEFMEYVTLFLEAVEAEPEIDLKKPFAKDSEGPAVVVSSSEIAGMKAAVILMQMLRNTEAYFSDNHDIILWIRARLADIVVTVNGERRVLGAEEVQKISRGLGIYTSFGLKRVSGFLKN